MNKLNLQLPKGMEIVRLKKISGKSDALMSLVDFSRYEVSIPFSGDATDAVENFNSTAEIIFTRITPKKTREFDAKKFIAERIKILSNDGENLILKFGIKISPEGSMKASEVLKILQENFGLDIKISAAKINRTALLSRGRNLLDLN